MHKYEIAILNALKSKGSLNFDELSNSVGIGKDGVRWAINNLFNSGLIEVQMVRKEEILLTSEGKEYAKNGLPEYNLLRRLGKQSIKLNTLKSDEDKIGLQWCIKKGYAKVAGDSLKETENGTKALEKMDNDTVFKIILNLASGKSAFDGIATKKEGIDELKARKLVEVTNKDEIAKVGITELGRGKARTEQKEDEIEELDRNMIKNGLWKGKKLKGYDLNVPVEEALSGKPNPLRLMIDEVKQAYLGMGFTEISGPIIEPSFWVFDTLFMPQDHPARDMQDTFYLSNPSRLDVEKDVLKRVKKEHEKGWHRRWEVEVAKEAVLRTQMTSVSGRYINKVVKELKQDKASHHLPLKLFSLGRVFRNENIDARHLADLYQTDGLIIGRNLTLANLFDVLTKIYATLGITVSFKPSYFPFVEPGLEIIGEKDGMELELGGAGIIRKEVSGVPRKTVNALAWGLGVERMLLIRSKGLASITELYNRDIGWIRRNNLM